MDLRFILVASIAVFSLKNSDCQQLFCRNGPLTSSKSSVILRTSETQSNAYEYSNDNGNCGCQVTVIESMSAALHITSRLTIPQENENKENKDEDRCGPYVMISNTSRPNNMVLTHQCPRPPMDNDTATYVIHLEPYESVIFALINQQSEDVKSLFNVTVLYGMVEFSCGIENQPSSSCPCLAAAYSVVPRTGDTSLPDRFVAAIVAVVLFLVLCAVVFCIYMVLKKRKARNNQTEGGPAPEKNNIDGSENKAYSGSQKSLDKQAKPEKLPRSKYSPETSPEKQGPNTSYIKYNSNDALNLSLQQPAGNKTPTGLNSIIGTADVRGSTESGIYSSADLIGPDQMYGANGTPQRPKPNLPPRTPSKEDLDAVYAKPNKPRAPQDYYSNVPGEQSPYVHQPAALPGGPPRSVSQDRLDARRAGSFERLDATPMTHRTPSQDRLDTSRDNAAYIPERRPQHGSQHSLHSETDV